MHQSLTYQKDNGKEIEVFLLTRLSRVRDDKHYRNMYNL